MCGIAGIVSNGSDSGQVAAMRGMLAMIRHRGPNQFGIYHDGQATLGSARLSIIDLDTGQQPISNEDETLWIVFNGEIYNYIELRPDLERRGHRFTTQSDTEVLLHLYEEWGPACLDRLNGQFAIAIWDTRKQELFLARDRLGVRPLFYTAKNGDFLFASEMKALLAYPGITAEINPVVLDQVFHYWSARTGQAIFRDMAEISPGHYLLWKSGAVRHRRYWQISFPPEEETSRWTEAVHAEEALEQFKALLVDSTLIRLRSDVPVGAYLSGGLDSSAIAHVIATRVPNELATFSVTFEDRDFDESTFQLAMARVLGTRHEIVHATHADIAEVFPDVVWHTEIPLTRTAPAPMFLLSRLVRDCNFKVVVTGEGADEFLAGYDIFKETAVRRFWRRHPESTLRPLLFRRLYPDISGLSKASTAVLTAFFGADLSEASHLLRWRNSARARRFYSEQLARSVAQAATDDHGLPELPASFKHWGSLQRDQYLECVTFLSQYLLSSQGDRVAMAHSVEARHPFLDYRLVEFCNRLPSSLKLRGIRDKYLLRQFGREFLPSEIWSRPKRPYRAPIHKSFFCGAAPDYVRELLSPAALAKTGFFNGDAVGRLVRKVSAGGSLGETDDMALAGILSTQILHQRFVDQFETQPPLSLASDPLKLCGPQFATSR